MGDFNDIEELRSYLHSIDNDDTIFLTSPAYISAVIGISDDSRLIYDYDLMVESLMKEDGISEDEAIDFVNYNTIRAIPYMGPYAPIVLHKLI